MHPRLRQCFQVIGLAYYHAVLGPRGRGRPTAAATSNAQYRSGHWRNFEASSELPRYAVIASYIRRRSEATRVLDVGCGYGRLMDELHPSSIGRYLGIDLSEEAIRQAMPRCAPNVSFAVGDFNTWRSDQRFDLIVFNDTLYYASHPMRVIERFAGMLDEGGAFLVGMYRHRNTMIIWNQLSRRFGVLDRVEVKNGGGEVTDIRLLGQEAPPTGRGPGRDHKESRRAMRTHAVAQQLEVGNAALVSREVRGEQLAGRVIDGADKCQPRTTPFEPVVVARIDLDKDSALTCTRPACAMSARPPTARRAHPRRAGSA